MSVVTLDTETTIYNKGNPFDERNFVVTIQIKYGDNETFCKWYDDPDFVTEARRAVESAQLLVGVNIKFDLHWLRNLSIYLPDGIRIWDCMLAEFILSGQTNSFASLNSLAELYGLPQKQSDIKEYWEKGISTEFIPRELVESYGNWDTSLTYAVYLKQLKDPRMTPELKKLILLDGLDLVVLQEMEYNGFKYNPIASIEESHKLSKTLIDLETQLLSYSPHPFNIDSGDQLSCFLYGGKYSEDIYVPTQLVYKSGLRKGQEYVQKKFSHTTTYEFPRIFKPLPGFELKKSTNEVPLYSTSDEVLRQLKATTKKQQHIISLLRERAVLSKLVGTYLSAFPALIEDMHWADNLIHGQFNQVVTRTGRLSSSRPNMQNAPKAVDQFFESRYAS